MELSKRDMQTALRELEELSAKETNLKQWFQYRNTILMLKRLLSRSGIKYHKPRSK